MGIKSLVPMMVLLAIMMLYKWFVNVVFTSYLNFVTILLCGFLMKDLIVVMVHTKNMGTNLTIMIYLVEFQIFWTVLC